ARRVGARAGRRVAAAAAGDRPRDGAARHDAADSAAWSVQTLGTNLTILVEEVLPGDDRAEMLARLYANPVKLARFHVAVDPHTPYSFRLPSKKGRVTLEFAGGKQQDSLDPTALAMKD